MIETEGEFIARRLGRVGASRISDIMAKGKGGEPSASRRNYMAELLCERLTGKYADGFTSAAIQWGKDHEDEARDAYELETGNVVTQCKGFPHPTIPMSGASPDGLIMDGEDIIGLLEIKCPNTWTHLQFIDSGKPDKAYQYQMTWQLACVRRDHAGPNWVDFVSFDPRLPDKLSFKRVRFIPTLEAIRDIEDEVKVFIAELDALETRMRGMM